MPRFTEVATLVVRDQVFYDWESVWVQQRWTEDSVLFRFTAAERDPIPTLWQRLQFKPRDPCSVYLGGQLAASGLITTRQTAYDANSHGVLLMGRGLSWYAARGSVLDKKGDFSGMTFEQAARKILAPFGVIVKTIGTLDATPFPRLQVNPGQRVWDVLEEWARPRGIILGSDEEGAFLLIGKHTKPIVMDLVEGYNILKMQCTIDVQHIYSDLVVRGQTAATDGHSGPTASEQEGQVKSTAARYSPLLTVAGQPVWDKAEVQRRAEYERQWTEGQEVSATVVVQGWFRGGGGFADPGPAGQLWRAGDHVMVKSPMAMLNQELKIEVATFTQDSNSGTLTTLDLKAPWLLNGKSDFNVGQQGVLQDPDSRPPEPLTQPESGPPEPPPATIPPPNELILPPSQLPPLGRE